MTDRRRNLIILALVGALLAGALAVIVTKPTRQGLDLKGGTELVYEAKPTRFSKVTGDAINRTIDIMRQRVDNLGVSEPQIVRSGANQIDVALPDVKNADQAQQQVGTTAQLFFYDWEKSVVGKDGKPHPDQFSGQGAGQPGAGTLTYYDAVTAASKLPPRHDPNNTTNGLWYGVDDKRKRVICGPQEGEADTRDACNTAGQKPSRIIEVPRGYVVVRSEADDANKQAQAVASDAYFVLLDRLEIVPTADAGGPGAASEDGARVRVDVTTSGEGRS
jgi:SecD/SecF fusion protein